MSEKQDSQQYEKLLQLIFNNEPRLKRHFMELFPTPDAFRNMTLEDQETFLSYDRTQLKPVLAAIKLGQLILTSPHRLLGHAYSSSELGRSLIEELAGQTQESVQVLCTDVHNEIVARQCLFKGGPAECMLYPDQIFRYALHWNAYGMVMVHNHPSGDPSPSKQDLSFMQRLEDGCRLLGLRLLDCLIIGRQDYYSWRESQEARRSFEN